MFANLTLVCAILFGEFEVCNLFFLFKAFQTFSNHIVLVFDEIFHR